ncbi:unnamed protein product [Rhodiola kirilowii]
MDWHSDLYTAALHGDWEKAVPILDEHGVNARRAIIDGRSGTPLHVAVESGSGSIPFVRNLVDRSTNADLEVKNADGCTPLEIAARVGNLEAAKVLIEKHSELLYIPSSSRKSDFPIHTAARYEHKEMLCYMLTVTETGHSPDPYDPEGSGHKLLRLIIKAEFYDAAFALIDCVSELGVFENDPTLTIRTFNTIAKNPSAFAKGLQVKKLLKNLCEKAAEKFAMPNAAVLLLKEPIIRAAENGIKEMVKEITDAFPYVDWCDKGHLLRFAIQNHHGELYMLLCDRYVDKGMQSVEEATKANILHVAGRLPASGRHRIESGAILQMQEDLNWFKEIERLVPPSYKNKRNKDGKTPQEVFTENHKNLMVEVEKRVKEIANSGTAIAGLILAISYAASITVPGGIRADNGLPVLGSESAFKIYGVANALSLFGACASLLMFLSIFTSRYTEGDFLRALPIKLVVGILSLYMAVASLMVSSTLIQYSMFGHGHERRWAIGCALVPCFLLVAMFAFGHFSLVAEIIKKTYLSRTLEKRSRRSSFLN